MLGSRVDLNGRHHLLPRDLLDLPPLFHPGRARFHPHHPTLDGVGVRPEGAGTLQVPTLDLDLHTTPRLPAQRKDVDDFRIGGVKVGGAGAGVQDSRQKKGENRTTAIPCSLSPKSHALASMEHESGESIPERALRLNLRGSSAKGRKGEMKSTNGHEEPPRATNRDGSAASAVLRPGKPAGAPLRSKSVGKRRPPGARASRPHHARHSLGPLRHLIRPVTVLWVSLALPLQFTPTDLLSACDPPLTLRDLQPGTRLRAGRPRSRVGFIHDVVAPMEVHL